MRELKGTLEAAANLASGKVIKPEHLRLPEAKARSRQVQTDADDRKLRPLADVEREHIVAVYRAVGNNKSQAARVLGIGLQTLIRRLKSYRIP